MNLLIQIGIGHACEYAYLVDPNQKCQHDEFELPPDMRGRNHWKVAGVEMSPFFCENARIRYPDIPFYDLAVVGEDFPAKVVRHQGWRLVEDGFPMKEGIWGWTGDWYETKTVSLRSLFEIVGKPTALVIDVENYELPILETYPWTFHRPEYLKIEMHSRKSADVLVPLIMMEGYSLLKFDPVNSYGAENNTNTSDAHFLRSDIAYQEQRRYEYGKED